MDLYDFSQIKVSCYNGHLKGSLAVVVLYLFICSPEQKNSCTAILVIESTHMQGGVSRCILGTHVSAIEQKVFEVLHMAIAARLMYLLPAILIHTADLCMVVQQKLTAVGVSTYH